MTAPDFHHVPVLLDETLDGLAIRPDGLYVDCTAGGGGHSSAIAARLPNGRLIALDRDPDAVAAASARIGAAAAGAWEVVHAPFRDLDAVLTERGLQPGDVHGILADLGVSSHQLDTAERGFSFAADGPLDMRMDPTTGESAAELLARIDERELVQLLFANDENKARRIARAIVRRRDEEPLQRTGQLADLVASVVPRKGRTHPATKTFQALRIAVNAEDEQLTTLLDTAVRWLAPGGRLALISFHSGEDRPVKKRLALLAKDCLCPPRTPICQCGWEPQLKLVQRKGWTAGEAELAANPRARSARLRVAERTEHPHQPLPPEARPAS